MSGAMAVTRLQLRILRSDPWFLVIMFGMALAIMPLMQETLGLSLIASGYADADGVEQVVPGQIVLFGFMVAGSVAFALFREHGWRTWDRLRASPASPGQLLAGFAIPWMVILVIFQLVLFASGALFFGLRLDGGSPVAVVLVVASYGFCVTSIVLLVAATLRTANQVNGLVNLGAMVFGGLGGAIAPVEQLPGWAQAVAPFTPQYWAMEGHQAVFLESGGIGDVLASVGVLSAIGLAAAFLAAMRFQVDETKEFFA